MLRRLAAEFTGTAMLLCAVVGSGTMAERLSGGNIAIALLANAVATGGALAALILMFAPVSGSHLNPVISLAALVDKQMSAGDFLLFSISQISGAAFGTAIANLMFDLPVFFFSTKTRTGPGLWLGEFVATFGLVGVVITVSRKHKIFVVAVAVAAYITAAYWFTSSTSFANPAVSIARSLTDTFSGIRPIDVPAFIAAQVLGGLSGIFFYNWLIKERDD